MRKSAFRSRIYAYTHYSELRQNFVIPFVFTLSLLVDLLALGTLDGTRLLSHAALVTLLLAPVIMHWVSRGPSPPAYLRPVLGKKFIKTPAEEVRALPGFGKVAVVTGANTGMGYENTKQLAALGYHVIMVCRDASKADAARGRIRAWFPHARTDVIIVDLDNLASLRGGAARIVGCARAVKSLLLNQINASLAGAASHNDVGTAAQPIDVFISNAGLFNPRRGLTAEGFNQMLQTNFLGPHILTRHLTPFINDRNGRVVTLASVMHIVEIYSPPKSFQPTSKFPQVQVIIERCAAEGKPVPSLIRSLEAAYHRKFVHSTYGLTKLLMVLEAKRLQHYFDGVAKAKQYDPTTEGTLCMSVHPGGVLTEIWRFLKQPVRRMFYTVMPFFFKRPEAGSLTALQCATAPRAELEGGGYYADCTRAVENELTLDPIEVKAAWAWVEAATGQY